MRIKTWKGMAIWSVICLLAILPVAFSGAKGSGGAPSPEPSSSVLSDQYTSKGDGSATTNKAKPGGGRRGGGSGGGGGAPKPGEAGRSFNISGEITDLYPGGRLTVPVLVTNPNPQALSVTFIKMTAKRSDSSACPPIATNIQTSNYTGPGFVVPANGSSTVQIPITMPNTAPDACQNVSFSLEFEGTGEQA